MNNKIKYALDKGMRGFVNSLITIAVVVLGFGAVYLFVDVLAYTIVNFGLWCALALISVVIALLIGFCVGIAEYRGGGF